MAPHSSAVEFGNNRVDHMRATGHSHRPADHQVASSAVSMASMIEGMEADDV